jgi:tetratricopeptide (TPR) repeat protein
MRFASFLAVTCLMIAPVWAEDTPAPVQGQASASTSIPVGPESPAEKRAKKLDRLLGQLHSAPVHSDTARIEAEIWEIWSRNDSPTAEVLLRQSSAAISARDFEPAERMLAQLLETYPDYAEGWNRRASLYYQMKRYDAAMFDIDHTLALEPRNFGALVGKGMILRATGKSDDAIAAFNEALAINPNLLAVKAAITQIEKDEPKI